MSLSFVKKMKRSIDIGKVFGALLSGLSKAFDYLNHDLLIAKLNASDLSLPVNRKQRKRINNSHGTWMEIIFGVPRRSVLGSLLFNIFCADFLFIVNSMDIATYADDNKPQATANDATFWSVLMRK